MADTSLIASIFSLTLPKLTVGVSAKLYESSNRSKGSVYDIIWFGLLTWALCRQSMHLCYQLSPLQSTNRSMLCLSGT